MYAGDRWRESVAAVVLTVAAAGSPVRAQTAADAPAVASPSRFTVRAYKIVGNKWLTPREVEDAVYPFSGPNKTPDDVEHARAALQSAFEKKGYATVSVLLPEQGVDTGIIRFDVSPQAIGTVTVSGTTKRDALLARAPSLRAGTVPDFKAVQRDIVALNSVPDRKVTPEVKAGVAPGTLDVNLTVEESSPLHGTVELNNYSSPTTSDLRTAATLRYDNLWGRGDSISVSAQTAPKDPDDGTVFSANYLMRLGGPQLLAYYVHSDSNIAVVGGASVIGKGDLGGLRLILPLATREGFYSSLTAGVDYKNFKEDVALGSDRSRAPIEYFPFTVGWRGDWSGERDKGYLAFNTTFGIRGLGDDAIAFDTKRYNARPGFIYVRGEAGRTQDVWRGFQASGRLAGQYSDAPLVSNEQFSVGGMESVRGYFESETLGDYGVAGQIELRSPLLLPSLAFKETRLLAFFDAGYSGIKDALAGQRTNQWLASAGGGVRLKAFRYFNGSLDVGVPLRDGVDTTSGDVFTRFRIWGEF